MSSGVVPHYRPCLLAWYLTIGHAYWTVFPLQPTIWLVEYRGKRDGNKSGATLTDMPVCTVQLYQTCMLGSFIQIHVLAKCFSIRQEIWYVANPPDTPTGKVQLPRVCKTYQLPAWTPFWIYQILSDASAASLRWYKDDVCNSRISIITILHAIPWSLPVSRKMFVYFCNKLPFWRPFCLYSYFIFVFLLVAKCLQLESNFIAINLRGKNGFETVFYITHFFSLIIGLHLGRHLGYIEMLNDARVASLGFFKDNICTTRINKEKKFKIKFQVLLKFAQILLDYINLTWLFLTGSSIMSFILTGSSTGSLAQRISPSKAQLLVSVELLI